MLHNLPEDIYAFLVYKKFFYPFGFLTFLFKIFKFVYGNSYQNFFEKDEVETKFKYDLNLMKVFTKRLKLVNFDSIRLKISKLSFSFSYFFYKRLFLFRRKFFILLKKSLDNQFLNFFSFFQKIFIYFLKNIKQKENLFLDFFNKFLFLRRFFNFFNKFISFPLLRLKNQFTFDFSYLLNLKNLYLNKFFFFKNFIKKNLLYLYIKRYLDKLSIFNFLSKRSSDNFFFKSFIVSKVKVVSFDLLIFLIKRLQYNKIYSRMLKHLHLLH